MASSDEDIKGILAANSSALDLEWIRGEWSKLSDPFDPKTEELEKLISDFYQP